MRKPIRNLRFRNQRQRTTQTSSAPAAPRLSSTRRRVRQRRRSKTQRQRRRGDPVKGAQNRLKRFSQATILAVAITGLMLLLVGGDGGEAQANGQQTPSTENVEEVPDTVAVIDEVATENLVAGSEQDSLQLEEEEPSAREATDEAIGTIRSLWNGFYRNLPKVGMALLVLVVAWGVAKVVRWVLLRLLGRWERSHGIITITSICVWLFFTGIALSIVVGDIRALVGSFGLIGLALSWSLQTPIESFTGWLLNSFQGYYRVGDRISVGDVFGDVYRIDFLTTTVWEIGAPYRPGFVQAEQPTGRLVTFPNNEVLTGTIVNLTRDFPYVWDEMSVAVANESNMKLALTVLHRVAKDLLGDYMAEPSRQYERILAKAGLDNFVHPEPQVFLSSNDSWTDIVIRYLVGARERRKWKSELTLRVAEELNKSEYQTKIIPVYTRQQVQFIGPDGIPEDIDDLMKPGEEKR
jgi:small-conductance mechanosensitive channel